jgi:hypothetical protein
MKLYSIYDKVANEYAQPFMVKNDAVATRVFAQAMSQGTPKNPNEYQLYRIANFDIESGNISSDLLLVSLTNVEEE